MYKVSTIVSLMLTLVFLAGCSALSAPVAKASSVNSLASSSGQLGFRAGSGENLVPPAEVYFYAPGAAYLNLGSGENVSRPAEPFAALRSVVSTSGENVVPPAGTTAYKVFHSSNP
jgi:hypothetical protein